MHSNDRVHTSWSLLRYSYGIVLLVIGLDKIFSTNIIVDWPMYVSPFVENLLPISVSAFVMLLGIIELIVGIMMLSKWTRLAAQLSAAVLVLIAINLLFGGYVDVAARDVLLAIGAYVLAELTLVIRTPGNA